MPFIELRPTRRGNTGEYLGDKVTVTFYKHKKALKNLDIVHSIRLTITLGGYVCKKYGFKAKDKVAILVDQDNPFLMRIKKSDIGYTLAESSSSRLILSVTWPYKTPKNLARRFASHILIDGQLQLAFAQDEITEDE